MEDWAARATRQSLAIHGRFSALLGIHSVNVLLTVLTLGFYRFWAKTRVRRYLWANTSLAGERLEYTGTGRELFLGFLIVVFFFLLPLFGGLEILRFVLSARGPVWANLPSFAATILAACLIPAAVYRARRYRLTRSQWRGIRAGQTGSAFAYAGLTVGGYALVVATLGLAYPLVSTKLTAYRMNHSWFGNRPVRFEVRAGPLYPPFLAVLGVYTLGFLILGALAVALGGALLASRGVDVELLTKPATEPQPVEMLGVALAGFAALGLAFVLGRVPWAWYKAAEYRHFSRGTRFEGLRFEARVRGGSLAWLTVGNLLLVIVTLGIALPYTYLRILRFWAERLHIGGEVDFAAIEQSARSQPRLGEGLADAFDVGGI